MTKHDDYEILELAGLINECLNPKSSASDIWMRRYLSLHSVIYYFEYSAGMVQTSEIALRDHLPDAIAAGAAVSAYANMSACIKLLDKAVEGISDDKLGDIKGKYKNGLERIKDLRHRVSAHPDEEDSGKMNREKFLVSKRSGFGPDGSVRIRQVSYDRELHKESRLFVLTPRQDLETLRAYLSETAKRLRELWCSE